MADKIIVFFEDIDTDRDRISAALKKEFKDKNVTIHDFKPNEENDKAGRNNSYEERLINYLNKSNLGEIELFIADMDLSKTESYTGLSETVVSKVSDRLSVPMCLYARGRGSNDLKKILKWTDYKIILDIADDTTKFARECRIIYDGFQKIKNRFRQMEIRKVHSPAEILAKILNKPDLQDRIALYGSGDKHMLADILPYFRDNQNVGIKKRIPRLLGYWLWDSILRYPGVVVNETAAASYLNIQPKDFEKKEIRKLFKEAMYDGPFSSIRPMWWRSDLDKLLANARCKDGFEFTQKKGKNVRQCRCSVDSKTKAGYYCMVTEQPVCEVHSRGNISWFPAGADLARIKEKEFNKLAPWIGLY